MQGITYETVCNVFLQILNVFQIELFQRGILEIIWLFTFNGDILFKLQIIMAWLSQGPVKITWNRMIRSNKVRERVKQ